MYRENLTFSIFYFEHCVKSSFEWYSIYESSPPQSPSGERRGKEVVAIFLVTNPPRGRPFGGGGVTPGLIDTVNLS